MRRFKVKIDDEVFEVEVEEIKGAGQESQISKAVPPAQVSTSTPAPKPVRAAAPAAAPKPKPPVSGENVVIAPIPGVIMEVKVSAGSSVKKGDVLLILEAMKMQNEVLAPYDAVVAEVLTAQGATVQSGDILVRFDS